MQGGREREAGAGEAVPSRSFFLIKEGNSERPWGGTMELLCVIRQTAEEVLKEVSSNLRCFPISMCLFFFDTLSGFRMLLVLDRGKDRVVFFTTFFFPGIFKNKEHPKSVEYPKTFFKEKSSCKKKKKASESLSHFSNKG